MRCFSAQYVFTCDSDPLKRAIVCTEDDGTVISVEDTGGNLTERPNIEFHNGIIVPGFVNSHCHLELSYMKDEIPRGTGLSGFLTTLTALRNSFRKDPEKSFRAADAGMEESGVVICGDICNSSLTFRYKKTSRIIYINFLEVFGIDPAKADKRVEEIVSLKKEADMLGLPAWIVPHAPYSISIPLFRRIKEITKENEITSFHFMESPDETEFLRDNSGPLAGAYSPFTDPVNPFYSVKDHVSAVLDEVTRAGNLILVHNTLIGKDELSALKARENIFYCLCPNSNLFIENRLPPASLLFQNECDVVLGTDSLSSNTKLSMIDEIRTLQENFPGLTLDTIIRWATINGARALRQDEWAGSISPGKKPGLVLISDMDLSEMRLLESSRSARLI